MRGYFISNHIEGANKWYFEPRRLVAIYAPLNGTLDDFFIFFIGDLPDNVNNLIFSSLLLSY
ncbi:MAG: hypothetical protein DRP02_02920 [Candidatus Gerdarchaeota archaeon]|nr:MAG: hypothetical protein DRP02_02920 [Candidatus Gerdarchaeota archaeon]